MCYIVTIGTTACTENWKWRLRSRFGRVLSRKNSTMLFGLGTGCCGTGLSLVTSGRSLGTNIWGIAGEIHRVTLSILAYSSGNVQLSL
jgi:hypothetical protein